VEIENFQTAIEIDSVMQMVNNSEFVHCLSFVRNETSSFTGFTGFTGFTKN
jgi:hypothetical protein